MPIADILTFKPVTLMRTMLLVENSRLRTIEFCWFGAFGDKCCGWLISLAGFGGEIFFEFSFDIYIVVGIGWGISLYGDIGPDAGVFSIQLKPFFHVRLSIGLNRIHRTFRFADAAVDAFVGMDHQHVLALIETIHRADFHAFHRFALDADFIDDIGHDTIKLLLARAAKSCVAIR